MKSESVDFSEKYIKTYDTNPCKKKVRHSRTSIHMTLIKSCWVPRFFFALFCFSPFILHTLTLFWNARLKWISIVSSKLKCQQFTCCVGGNQIKILLLYEEYFQKNFYFYSVFWYLWHQTQNFISSFSVSSAIYMCWCVYKVP